MFSVCFVLVYFSCLQKQTGPYTENKNAFSCGRTEVGTIFKQTWTNSARTVLSDLQWLWYHVGINSPVFTCMCVCWSVLMLTDADTIELNPKFTWNVTPSVWHTRFSWVRKWPLPWLLCVSYLFFIVDAPPPPSFQLNDVEVIWLTKSIFLGECDRQKCRFVEAECPNVMQGYCSSCSENSCRMQVVVVRNGVVPSGDLYPQSSSKCGKTFGVFTQGWHWKKNSTVDANFDADVKNYNRASPMWKPLLLLELGSALNWTTETM